MVRGVKWRRVILALVGCLLVAGVVLPDVTPGAAVAGFLALGSAADTAIPKLIGMLREPDEEPVHEMMALSCIGTSSIPALVAVLAKTNEPSYFRLRVIQTLRGMAGD